MWMDQFLQNFILVSCILRFIGQCADINGLLYQLRDAKGNNICHGAYLDHDEILVPTNCVNGIDYTTAVVVSVYTIKTKYGLEVKEVKHKIGMISEVPLSKFSVVNVVENLSYYLPPFTYTPLSKNATLGEDIVTSCSEELQYNRSIAREITKPYREEYGKAYDSYIVQIKSYPNAKFLCPGTWLTHRFVVTAAECFDDVDFKNFVIDIGRRRSLDYFRRIKIVNIIIHPDYNSQTKTSNLAVLEVNTPPSYYRYLEFERVPLCKRPLQKNDYVKVIGWSCMTPSPRYELYSTIIPVMLKENSSKTTVPEQGVFYTVGNSLNDQICVSDLGGPAILNGELCGIASSCFKCDGFDYSNTFMDLFYYRDFILSATGARFCTAHSNPYKDLSGVRKLPTSEALEIYKPLTINKASYLVQLRDDNGEFICAGTLISNDSVLTAGDCVRTIPYKKLVVVAGAETLNEQGVQRQIYYVTIINRFGIGIGCEDIALLKLNEPLISGESLNDNFETVPLFENYIEENMYVQVIGWRGMYAYRQHPEETKLTSTLIRVTPGEKCHESFSVKEKYSEFCAKGNIYENQFCVSDMGGPALCGGKLCGIVNSCSTCYRIDYSNRFIDVKYVEDYIKQALNGKL